MATAKELLDERLAKGEVSHEEYDSILSKLSTSSKGTGEAMPMREEKQSNTDFVITKKGWFVWIFPMMVMLPIRVAYPVDLSVIGQIIIWGVSLCMVYGVIKVIFGKGEAF